MLKTLFRPPDTDQPLLALETLTEDLVALDGCDMADMEYASQMVTYRLYNLLAGIRQAEWMGCQREDIVAMIEPARQAHAQSPFVKRAQLWPRGYPGDFETIEYLCDAVNTAAPGSIGYLIERYALSSAVTQQHRNKVAWQAAKILEVCLDQPVERRILSVACGGSRDLRSIQSILKSQAVRVYLNDFDADALAFSLGHLQGLADKVQTLPGNVFRATAAFRKHGPYDLVLAGGLFDYLTDDQLIWLLPRLFECVAPGGRLCFTNLMPGNPLRVWMQYLANWIALERSEADIRRVIQVSSLREVGTVRIERDLTGLAALVELTKAG